MACVVAITGLVGVPVAHAAPSGRPTVPSAPDPTYSAGPRTELISCAADPTAVIVNGKARVYFATSGEGPCRSSGGAEPPDSMLAPLTTGKGRLDRGVRVSVRAAGPHKRIVKLPDGRYRMFFQTPPHSSPAGIGSAISSDGLHFSVEPGLRISRTQAGVGKHDALSPGDVVRTKDGRYRLYFSSFDFGASGPDVKHVVKSAVSRDLRTWQVEKGTRIGAGAAISGSGEHPSAVRLRDGSVVLFYGRRLDDYGLYYSWSPDGLTFSKESFLIPEVLDSSFLLLPDGSLSGFVGRRDNQARRSHVDRVTLVPR